MQATVRLACPRSLCMCAETDVEQKLTLADGVGERLHGDRDDDGAGGGRREAVRALLARRGLVALPHLRGCFPAEASFYFP